MFHMKSLVAAEKITNILIGTHVGSNDHTASACQLYEDMMEQRASMINEEVFGNGSKMATIETFSRWSLWDTHTPQQCQRSLTWHTETQRHACEFKHCKGYHMRRKATQCNSTINSESMMMKYWMIIMMSVAFAVKHVMVRMMTLACTANGWRWPRSAVPTGSDSSRMLHDEICVSIVITASVHKTGKNESQELFVESTVGGCIRWWVLPGAVMSAVYARIVPIRIQAEKVSIYGGDVATTVPVAQSRVSCLYHYKHNICIVNWLWSFRPYKYDKMIWTNIMASVVVIILRVILAEYSHRAIV